MSLDDTLRELLNGSMEPVEPPPGLADELIARAASGGAAATGGASSGVFGLPLIIGIAIGAGAIIGGALGFFGGGDAQAGGTLSLDGVPAYACPGNGEVATLYRGDRVLITGRSGDWLAVRNVRGANERVFVHTDHVTADAELTGLPEENCDDSGVLTLASGETTTTISLPDDTTTTVVIEETTTTTTTTAGDTTTTITPATTTTTPPSTSTTSTPTTTTTAPDTTLPFIGQQDATPGAIWEEDGLGISCPPGTARESIISAIVTDDTGITSVTASWNDPDGNQSIAMANVGIVYTMTFGPYAAGEWDPLPEDPGTEHTVTITITARDAAGNKSSRTVNVTVWEIGKCFI
jgi:hypothetical protein